MSKQLHRKTLKVNQRRGIKQHFQYVEGGYKSDAQPSVVAWKNPGRGVQGESVNSSDDVGSKQIVNRNWRPM